MKKIENYMIQTKFNITTIKQAQTLTLDLVPPATLGGSSVSRVPRTTVTVSITFPATTTVSTVISTASTFTASTTAISTSTTVVATATATTSAGLSFVDGDAAAVEILTVHSLNSVPHRLLITEGNESEAPRSTSLTIVDDLRIKDIAVGAEGLLQGTISGSPSQATDEATVLEIGGSHTETLDFEV